MTYSHFVKKCKDVVLIAIEREHDWESIDAFQKHINFIYDSLHITWFSKTLQNHKALVMSTDSLFDKTYWEVTYNGDKDEYYVDKYIKQSNTVILGEDIDETM